MKIVNLFSLTLIFMLLFSCDTTQVVPENVNFITENQKVVNYAKNLGLSVTENVKIDKNNCIKLDNQGDMETFIKLIKNKNQDKIRVFLNRTQDIRRLNFIQKKLSKSSISNIKELNFVVDCPNTNGGFIGSTSFGLGNLNFGLQTNSGNLTSVNPYMSGFTVGISYTYGTFTGFTRNSFGDMSFTVDGTANYNIFFEGIGTIYSQREQYLIKIRCNGVVTVTAI